MAAADVFETASTLHALDLSFWPEERRGDVDEHGDVLKYVPVATEGKGRLTARDETTGEYVNDVWGFFMSNIILSREDVGAQGEKFRDLLSLVSGQEGAQAQEQALQWNDWTQELKDELARRKIADVLPARPFLNATLTKTLREPKEPEKPEEPGEEEEQLRRLLGFFGKFSGAWGKVQDFLDTPEGKGYADDANMKKILRAFETANKLPKRQEGETDKDRMIVVLMHLSTSIPKIGTPLGDFGDAHTEDADVQDLVARINLMLGFG